MGRNFVTQGADFCFSLKLSVQGELTGEGQGHTLLKAAATRVNIVIYLYYLYIIQDNHPELRCSRFCRKGFHYSILFVFFLEIKS